MARHIAIVVAVACALVASLAGRPADVDVAFNTFWAAASPDEATGLVDRVVRSGVRFDEAHRRLRQGRTYTAQKTGVVRFQNRTPDGVEHHYTLNVPDTYDPARRYQVRIHLHGGVGGRASNAPVGTGAIGALSGAEQIYVIPYAWADAPWWSHDQVLNLVAIVDAAKRLYNVDENRVVVSGVSDGGTGAYFVAMHETTPFASFLPLNGYLMVLASRDIDDGTLFPNNLRNKPLFAVNGGRDPLYPTAVVDPYIGHMKRGGVSVDYHPQPNAGHNTAWWPEVKETFEAFVREHPRRPLPDVLTWETGDTAAGNRAHWLVIDRLGAIASRSASLASPGLPGRPAGERSPRRSAARIPSEAAKGESRDESLALQTEHSNAERPGDRSPDQPPPGLRRSAVASAKAERLAIQMEESLADLNDMAAPPSADFGVRSIGMRINRVMPGSNADRIGLRAGDVLVRLNDQSLPAAFDVADALEDTPPGSKIDLLVARENQPVELSGIYQPQIVPSPPRHLFARVAPSGRVDLVRAGNTVTATTRGVAAFTLLLSPDQFDFGKPVKVVANGRTVFEGKVEKSVRTLLKFAAADNDRTMLFGAELHLDLSR